MLLHMINRNILFYLQKGYSNTTIKDSQDCGEIEDRENR